MLLHVTFHMSRDGTMTQVRLDPSFGDIALFFHGNRPCIAESWILFMVRLLLAILMLIPPRKYHQVFLYSSASTSCSALVFAAPKFSHTCYAFVPVPARYFCLRCAPRVSPSW